MLKFLHNNDATGQRHCQGYSNTFGFLQKQLLKTENCKKKKSYAVGIH